MLEKLPRQQGIRSKLSDESQEVAHSVVALLYGVREALSFKAKLSVGSVVISIHGPGLRRAAVIYITQRRGEKQGFEVRF